MSDKDSKSTDLNAKNSTIAEQFNLENAVGEQIASASPDAQNRVKDRLQLRDDRMEKERRDQGRSYQFRLNREKNQMMEKYITEDALRPNTAEARAQDLQIINEQAERRVNDRQDYYLNTIDREAKADVQQILSGDRQQAHEAQHSGHEQER